MSDERIADLELRVEELRRVNEELGRQLVSGGGSRQPRSAVTASRALAKLAQERDGMEAELRATAGELSRLREENARLRREVNRLLSGALGLLRRVGIRLRRH